MSTPDVTKAQLLALVQAAVALAVAFGLRLTDVQQAAIVGFSAAVFVVLVSADAAIRRARAQHLGEARELAGIIDTPTPAPVSKHLDAITREAEYEDRAHVANGPQPAPGTYPDDPPGGASDEPSAGDPPPAGLAPDK